MKTFGFGLLVAGFIWIAFDAGSSFVSYQYIGWISKSKSLPVGDAIRRKEAVSALREYGLSLRNRHRLVMLPSVLMLAGGLLIYFAPKSRNEERQAEQGAGADR